MFKCSTEPWSERGKVLMASVPRQNPGPQKSIRILLLILMKPGFHSRERQKGQLIQRKEVSRCLTVLWTQKSEIAVALCNLYSLALLHETERLIFN